MQALRKTFAAGAFLATPALLFPASAGAGALTPESPASPNASDLHTAYVVALVIALLIGIALIAGLLASLRGGGDENVAERRAHGTAGFQGWVIGGLAAIALAVFTFGVLATESARDVEPTGPDGLLTAQTSAALPEGVEPLNVRVTGQQWVWRFEYPDGTFSYQELVVPADTTVVLDIESIDVRHTWWIPALGGQVEVVPGSPAQTWFKAEETGRYDGRSTAFSGPGFVTMRNWVNVVEPDEYESWLADQAAGIQEAQEAVAAAVAEGTAPGVEPEEGEDSEGPSDK